MSIESKKKKKVQVLEPQQKEKEELAGSGEYLADHKFDRIRRTFQTNILQGEQTKKLEILRAAKEYEDQGYPITKICDRVTKDVQEKKYNTSGSYVRGVLPPKYKDPVKSAEALQQNNGRDSNNRDQEEVRKKDVKDIGLEDIKFLNWTKAKQVAKYQMQKNLWLEQQDKQQEQKQETFITEFAMDLTEHIVKDLKGQNNDKRKYAYQVKIKVKVDPVNHTAEYVGPLLILRKPPLDLITGKMTEEEYRIEREKSNQEWIRKREEAEKEKEKESKPKPKQNQNKELEYKPITEKEANDFILQKLALGEKLQRHQRKQLEQ